MKIIKFEDGTYGIRKRSFLYLGGFVYFDFTSRRHFWWRLNEFPNDIRTDLAAAKRVISRLKDKGTEVTN
jgi:hypothetical protein